MDKSKGISVKSWTVASLSSEFASVYQNLGSTDTNMEYGSDNIQRP